VPWGRAADAGNAAAAAGAEAAGGLGLTHCGGADLRVHACSYIAWCVRAVQMLWCYVQNMVRLLCRALQMHTPACEHHARPSVHGSST
jgi:hypothetical protein